MTKFAVNKFFYRFQNFRICKEMFAKFRIGNFDVEAGGSLKLRTTK